MLTDVFAKPRRVRFSMQQYVRNTSPFVASLSKHERKQCRVESTVVPARDKLARLRYGAHTASPQRSTLRATPGVRPS
jgi:hypothetical protein